MCIGINLLFAIAFWHIYSYPREGYGRDSSTGRTASWPWWKPEAGRKRCGRMTGVRLRVRALPHRNKTPHLRNKGPQVFSANPALLESMWTPRRQLRSDSAERLYARAGAHNLRTTGTMNAPHPQDGSGTFEVEGSRSAAFLPVRHELHDPRLLINCSVREVHITPTNPRYAIHCRLCLRTCRKEIRRGPGSDDVSPDGLPRR